MFIWFLKCFCGFVSKFSKRKILFLTRFLILIKKGGLLQLEFVDVGVNIYSLAQ